MGRVIRGFDKGLLDLGLYELTSRVIWDKISGLYVLIVTVILYKVCGLIVMWYRWYDLGLIWVIVYKY